MQGLDHNVDSCKLLGRSEGRAVPAGSLAIQVKVESAETGTAFALIEVTMQASGWKGPKRHIHRSGSETFFVLEGTLEILAGTKTIKAEAGTCAHVPAGAVHTFSNPGPGPVRFLQIVTPGSLLTMIEETSALLTADVRDRDQIAAVLRRHDTEVVA